MFIDNYLLDTTNKTTLRMNPHQRREIVLKMDKPWEGSGSEYIQLFLKW